jgi:hypothetical protein
MSAEFPRPNNAELIYAYIEGELRKEGINIQGMSIIDGTVITDEEVPNAVMSRIRQYAANRGMTIKFQTSDSGGV